MTRRSLRRTGITLTAVLVLVAGCGDGSADGGPAAQPAPEVSTFEQGDFDDLPLPPRHTPVGERVEEDGVVSRSFEVRNMAPEAVLDWYAEALAAFEVLEAPERIGVGSYRGQWDLAGRELTVAAQSAETLADNPGAPEVLSQLSLSLAPPGMDTNAP